MTAQLADLIELPDGSVRLLHTVPDIFGPKPLRRVAFVPRPTFNVRGYSARWRIAEDRLWLVSLGGTIADPVFGEPTGEGDCGLCDIHGSDSPVFAGWITMDLLMPEPERPWRWTDGPYLRLPVAAGLQCGPIEPVTITASDEFLALLKARRP